MQVRKERALTDTPWSPKTYKPEPATLRLKLLAYGRPGAGKTTLAATASVVPELFPVLYINAESGIMSICESWPDRIDRENISVVDFEGYAQLQKLFEYLAFGKHPYKTVVLDSLTELLAYVVGKWKEHLIPKDANGVPISEESDKKMGLKVYERATDQMRTICRRFRDLPMHVIMVCHEGTSDMNGLAVTHPDLTPALLKSVMSYVDIAAYMTTREVSAEGSEKEVTYLLTCTPRPSRYGKDRTPQRKLGGVIQDATMSSIWSRVTTTTKKEETNGTKTPSSRRRSGSDAGGK